MSIQKALFDYLTNQVNVKALIGDRMYPEAAKTGTEFPYLTYTLLSNPGHQHMGGVASIADPTIQIDVWAKSPETREDVTLAVNAALEGYRGPMGEVDVRRIFKDSETYESEKPQDGSENYIFRTRQDWHIWHLVIVPTIII